MNEETGNVINVMIVDDHVLYRAGVKTALSSKKDIKIIAEADNGAHLLNMLKGVQPDVILLDIQMPIMDGITALPEIKKLYPGIKVIMLTFEAIRDKLKVKTGTKSTAGLIMFAVKNNLLDQEN
jgi:DNA-binding NarL/FixJ family response regulator